MATKDSSETSKTRAAAAVRSKVEQVLKTAIDAELARASTALVSQEEGPSFSRGIIFSRTNPFSRGIFFSRVQGSLLERQDDIEREVALDPVVLGALAERLTQIKAVKELKGEFTRGRSLAGKTIERE